jgi:hypothetical protein
MNATSSTVASSNTATNGAPPAAQATSAAAAAPAKAPRRSPIHVLMGLHTVSLIERDFGAVLTALGWDPNENNYLSGGETVAMNGKNVVKTSKEIFAGCEIAWGKRPGTSSKDPGWQAFDAAVGRVMAQARRAFLIKDSAGVVCTDPDKARDGESTPRPRKSASLVHDGLLSGQAWPAHCGEAIVAALGNVWPGREALHAALVSQGFIFVIDKSSGITTIEAPKPRIMSAEQTAKMEKADTLERKANGLEKDGLVDIANSIRKTVAEMRAAVEAEFAAGAPAQAPVAAPAGTPPVAASQAPVAAPTAPPAAHAKAEHEHKEAPKAPKGAPKADKK